MGTAIGWHARPLVDQAAVEPELALLLGAWFVEREIERVGLRPAGDGSFPGLRPRTRTMKPLRRFNMADAMVMIAATAVALAFVQFQGLPWILAEKWFPPKDNILRPPEDGDLAALISSFLIPWTVALFFLRFRQPRPSRRRLFVRPGFVACAIAIAMMVFLCLDEYRQCVFAYRSFIGTWRPKRSCSELSHFRLLRNGRALGVDGGLWPMARRTKLDRPSRPSRGNPLDHPDPDPLVFSLLNPAIEAVIGETGQAPTHRSEMAVFNYSPCLAQGLGQRSRATNGVEPRVGPWEDREVQPVSPSAPPPQRGQCCVLRSLLFGIRSTLWFRKSRPRRRSGWIMCSRSWPTHLSASGSLDSDQASTTR